MSDHPIDPFKCPKCSAPTTGPQRIVNSYLCAKCYGQALRDAYSPEAQNAFKRQYMGDWDAPSEEEKK